MATEPRARGRLATRFWWLLLLSLFIHTLLTPLPGWIGLLSGLLPPAEVEAPPLEELDSIPVELLEAVPEEAAQEQAENALPESDPVALIDELVPVAPAETAKPKPKAPKPAPTAAPPAPTAEPEDHTDAGAPLPVPSAPPAPSAPPSADAGPVAKQDKKEPKRRGSNIGDAVALAGETGKLTESNARLALTLYTDRIRSHPVGERIEKLLPSLPQWKDFFGGQALNPIRDFDRFFMAGPSFYHTEQVVVALQYNAKPEKIRLAIDQLVQRRGEWLKGTTVPAALAYADRANRLFVMAAPQFVVVAPPQLKAQILSSRLTGIPAPKGKEALVAFTKQPRYALARLGLEVSETLRDAKLLAIPLAGGAVRLEVTAQEVSPEAAKATAGQVAQALNSLLSLASGASSFLSQFGIGGKAVSFPRIDLKTDGKLIYAEVELQQAQIDFILDRAERQLIQRRPVVSPPAPTARERVPARDAPRPKRAVPVKPRKAPPGIRREAP